MPKQYVLFGRPVPRLGTRRFSLLLGLLSFFALFSLLLTVPAGPSLHDAEHKYKFTSIPKSLKGPWQSMSMSQSSFNPFRQPSHPPPRQANDTDGEASWYSNWKWLSIPFSSSITLDENRALLPDLRPRTPIYCYYDNTVTKDAINKEAESELLLTWRRAWWAHGFRPVILSPAEAMNNPVYEELQRMESKEKLDPVLKTDVMRWLAWENMGGGLLAHYLLFPMAAYDDPLLTYLRRGDFPSLTRWSELDDGLFAGTKADVAKAIKRAMASPSLKTAKEFLSVVETKTASTADEPDLFAVDSAPKSLAFYSPRVIEKKYTVTSALIETDRAAGLRSLNDLVNSHLHLTWQSVFSSGISVVKPLPHHTTHMIAPAYDLAQRLVHCSDSPIPASCPPNRPSCAPCVASTPMKVVTPSRYHNTSTLYVIGTVPHPYTLSLLNTMKETVDIKWIRRSSERDEWLADLTKGLLGTAVSGAPRVLRFKEAVASELGAARSLWLSAETSAASASAFLPADIDWHFGFAVPTNGTWADMGRSETPVPGPERRPPPPPADPKDGPVAEPKLLEKEPGLLARARAVVLNGRKPRGDVTEDEVRARDALEAWNLADTEAWRFARAYLARRSVERRKWEDDEEKYAGGVGSEKGLRGLGGSGMVGSTIGRWMDSDKE